MALKPASAALDRDAAMLPEGGMRGSLGKQLVVVTMIFCLLFTVATVALRTWFAWNSGLSEMDAELAVVEQVYQHALTKAIWEMDNQSIELHLATAARVTAIGKSELTLTPQNRPPVVLEKRRADWVPSALAPVRRSVLTYEPFPGGAEKVGQLALFGDERVLWDRLRKEALPIFVAQVIQSVLLAALIMMLFNRSVTTHVRKIAMHLTQLRPDNLTQALTLDRPQHRSDELTLLSSGINYLQLNLSAYLEKQRQAEEELARHRDHLAELVKDRTGELESLTSAQQLVLALSNRLMNAPFNEFITYQFGCLQEVAQRLGAIEATWYAYQKPTHSYTTFLHWPARADTAPGAPILLSGWQLLHERLLRERQLFFTTDTHLRAAFPNDDLTAFGYLNDAGVALALLQTGEELFGLLVFRKTQAAWRPDDQALVAMASQMLLQSVLHESQVSNIIASQAALRALNGQLDIMSRSDALTGLYNRRHFDEAKNAEFKRAMRTGQPLALLICDIDFFKLYNDTYGHAQGDTCLKAVAEAMATCVGRPGDILARIGGEEFALLLPSTTADGAVAVGEKFRAAVNALRIEHAASAVSDSVTLSVGVAVIDFNSMKSFEALFQRADQALYQAKRNGRNRVACIDAEDQPLSHVSEGK